MVKVHSLGSEECFDAFTMLLLEGSTQTGLFRHFVTKFFGVRKFKNGSPVKVIFFFWKILKIEPRFPKCNKEMRKCFFVSQIISSEDVTINCLYKGENTCSRQLMSWQTVLRFYISLRETFPNWIAFTVILKFDKSAFVQISTVFRPVYHVTCQRLLWDGTF